MDDRSAHYAAERVVRQCSRRVDQLNIMAVLTHFLLHRCACDVHISGGDGACAVVIVSGINNQLKNQCIIFFSAIDC